MRCRVLIWSKRAQFVKAMRSLAVRQELDVIGIARTPDAAVECAQIHRPDVILVDRDTEVECPAAVVRLAEAAGGARIVAMDLGDEMVFVLEGWRGLAPSVRDLIRVITGDPVHQVA